MLDVHEDQLLMLFLVIDAELDERRGIGPGYGIERAHERRHRPIDMGAIALDLGDARTRDQSSLRPRMAGAYRLVIGIEEIAIGRIEGAITGKPRRQQEGLEEPAG